MRFILSVFAALLSSTTYAADTCSDIVADCKALKNCPMVDRFMVDGKPAFSPDSIEVVKKNLDEIMEDAMLNRIDPRAFIGSILAANTVNGYSPGESFLRKLPLSIASRFTNIGPFYGIGRLSINAAMEVETSAYPKKWDPTASSGRSRKVVAEALGTDSTALMKAGEYLRYGQEMYAKNNWSIDEKPEILATLYSMGRIEDRIEATKREGREPRINDWGALVACNADVIQKILAEAKSLKGAVTENDCIYAPALAKITDWKFRCLQPNGTFKMDLKQGTSNGNKASPAGSATKY
jgi:hypothetical protein